MSTALRRKSFLSHRLSAAVFAVCLIGPQAIFAAAVSWDGGAGNTDWYSANNWSNNLVPTLEDDVTIDANVTVTVAASTPAIRFRSLTIGGNNTATLKLAAGAAKPSVK